MFYVDVPSNVVALARQALSVAGRRSTHAPQVWRHIAKSRGSVRDHPRDIITGTVDYNFDLQSKAILDILIECLDAAAIDFCVGRQQIFKDKNAIIFEISKSSQFLSMRPFLGECVFLSPSKCLCTPNAEGSVLTTVLTDQEELHTARFKFSMSGPMRGKTFASARAVREHISTKKTAASALRQPESARSLLEHQAIIQVLHYENMNSPNIASIIIDTITDVEGISS